MHKVQLELLPRSYQMNGGVQCKHSNVQNAANASACKAPLLCSVMRGKALAVKDHTPVLYSAANLPHPRSRDTEQFGENGKIVQNLGKFRNFAPRFPDAIANCASANFIRSQGYTNWKHVHVLGMNVKAFTKKNFYILKGHEVFPLTA